MEWPIRDAVHDDVHIAYQVVGDGPIDLVYTPAILVEPRDHVGVASLGATAGAPISCTSRSAVQAMAARTPHLGDFAAFWPALFAGRIVPPPIVDEMVRPHNDVASHSKRYGLGFWIRPDRATVVLEGYDAGVSFRSAYDPASQLLYTVMSNTAAGAWPLVDLLTDCSQISRGCSSCVRHAAVDSLFDSLLRTICDTPGRSVAQTRQIARYVSHSLTCPDTSRQGWSISS